MELLVTRFCAAVETAQETLKSDRHVALERRLATIVADRVLAVTRADRRLVETARHMDEAKPLAEQIAMLPAVFPRHVSLQRKVTQLMARWREVQGC